jgi:uncharacterized protein YbaP (TraB family)
MKCWYLVLLALPLVSCTFYKPQIPGFFYDDGYYKNSQAGFKVHLPDDWTIGTTPKTVPESLKKTIKEFQTNSSEMLFVGLNKNERCGIRCIAEANDTTLEAYFKVLYSVNESGVIKDRADYYKGRGQECIVWTYTTEQSGTKYKFIDYIFRNYGLKFRVSFWTLAGLFNDYKKSFEESAKTICLTDTAYDTSVVWYKSTLLVAKDSSEESHTIDYATDNKELFFPTQDLDTICNGRDQSFLWKVSNGKSICYLMGSIHILKPEMYPLKTVIENAFDSCSSLVLEVNTSSPENQQKMVKFAKEGIYQDSKTLWDEISPPLKEQLLKWVKKRGLPEANFGKMKPWMGSLVMQQIELKSLGLSAEYGIEQYFLKKKSNKEILELETVDEQIQLLASFKSENFLAYTLLDIENTEKKFNTLLTAWKCGNAEVLKEITFSDSTGEAKQILDKLFYERNTKMAEKIKKYIENGKKCFVVIGSGHLVGAGSVVDLLGRSGFKLEQL